MNQVQNDLRQIRQSLNNLNQHFNSLKQNFSQHNNQLQQISQTIDRSFQHLNSCERATASNTQGQFATSPSAGTNQYQSAGTTGQTSMYAASSANQPYGAASMGSSTQGFNKNYAGNTSGNQNVAYKSQGAGWNPQEDRVTQTPITSTANRDADVGSSYYNMKPAAPAASQYTGMNNQNSNMNNMNKTTY